MGRKVTKFKVDSNTVVNLEHLTGTNENIGSVSFGTRVEKRMDDDTSYNTWEFVEIPGEAMIRLFKYELSEWFQTCIPTISMAILAVEKGTANHKQRSLVANLENIGLGKMLEPPREDEVLP